MVATTAATTSSSSSPSNHHHSHPPPSPSLITIPTTILAGILSYTSKKQRDIIQICSCHSSLWKQHSTRPKNGNGNEDDTNDDDDENLWRYLCHLSFPCSKERISHWPSPTKKPTSWMSIYAILEEWVPREGFYNILNANPWGMMVLLRFHKGDVIGQILWHNDDDDDDDDDDESDKDTTATTTLHNFIQISNFNLAKNKVALSSSSGKLFDKIPIQLSPVKDTASAVVSGALSFPEIIRGGPFTFLSNIFMDLSPHPSPHALCIAPLDDNDDDEQMEEENENGAGQEEGEEVAALNSDPWNPFNTTTTTNGSISDMIYKLWNTAQAAAARNDDTSSHSSLVMDYVKLPSMSLYHHLCSSSSSAHYANSSSSSSGGCVPLIQPGLYSGSYDNSLYGKFSREVVLVDYIKYDLSPISNNHSVWNDIQNDIFRFEKQRDDANLYNSLCRVMEEKYAAAEEIVFVLGKKVTGDIHVSAGEISWGAVVSPPVDFSEIMGSVGSTTSSSSSRRHPDQIRDRSNGKLYNIQRKWFGFGTLAYPGFRDPGWSPGHLVYLGKVMSVNSTLTDAFGFSWDGQEEEEGEGDSSIVESTVLTWVDLQNKYISS